MDVTDMQLYLCPTSTKKYVVPELVCVLVTYYPEDLDQQSAISHDRVH
jgi:hypothetical protein